MNSSHSYTPSKLWAPSASSAAEGTSLTVLEERSLAPLPPLSMSSESPQCCQILIIFRKIFTIGNGKMSQGQQVQGVEAVGQPATCGLVNDYVIGSVSASCS